MWELFLQTVQKELLHTVNDFGKRSETVLTMTSNQDSQISELFSGNEVVRAERFNCIEEEAVAMGR